MFKTSLKYGATLIGAYLVLYYYTGAGTVLDKGSSAIVNVTKGFQGRG